MPILLQQNKAADLLQSSYSKITQLNGNDAPIPFKSLSDFTLLSKPIEHVDRVLIESYNLELIKAWKSSISNETETAKLSGSNANKFKYTLLTILGTLYFACEGFDGMTALLGIFSLPATLLMAAGILFSILSIVIFYSFDLVEISKNLEVNWHQTPKLVDLYVEQIDQMKQLIRAIAIANNDKNLNEDEKLICLEWLEQLENQHKMIAEQCTNLQRELDRPIISMSETAVTCLAGLIHFSGGFFAGQTVMISICTLLSLSTSPTFLPIICFSILIGLAALSIYWYVEKPGIEKFVSRWIGIDKEKLEKLEKPGRIENKLNDIKTLSSALGIFGKASDNMTISDRSVDTLSQSFHIQGYIHK